MQPNQQPNNQPNQQPGNQGVPGQPVQPVGQPMAQPTQQPVQPVQPQQQPGNNIFTPPNTPQPTMAPVGMPAAGGNNGMVEPPKKKKGIIAFIASDVLLGLLVIVLLVTTVYFFGKMNDYKNNSDAKSAVAVEKATDLQKQELEAQFAEEEKNPVRTYTTPGNAAAVKIVYPKTWDLYSVEESKSGTVKGHFRPDFVNNIADKENTYALRIEVLDRNYADIVKSLDSNIKKGLIKVSPYKVPLVESGEVGVRVDGEVRKGVQGSMIIIPVRNKTIQLWTESGNFTKDFDEIVLQNLVYNP